MYQPWLTLQRLEDTEKIFVKEVFAGCVRYGSVLDVVVTSYYRSDGYFVLNSEQPLLKGISLEIGRASCRERVSVLV